MAIGFDPPWRLDPHQNIVNVGWGGGPHILAIVASGLYFADQEGSPPVSDYSVGITLDTFGGGFVTHEILKSQFLLARAGAAPPEPPIEQEVTDEMLAYYAAWAYVPYELNEVFHSSGGGYYFITPSGGVFPDFVASPYASEGDAQAYLDAQAIIHPEYAGMTFGITLFPSFDTYSQEHRWKQITLINLASFPRDAQGRTLIDFAGDGSNVHLVLDFRLCSGSFPFFPADAENDPIGSPFPNQVASYVFDKGGGFADPVSGTVIVKTSPPAITGPASVGGGGGGG